MLASVLPEAINCLNQAIEIYTDMVSSGLAALICDQPTLVLTILCACLCVCVLLITGSVHDCSQASHHHSRDLWVWAGWYWEGKTEIVFLCLMWDFKIYLSFQVQCCWNKINFVILFLRPLPTTSRQQIIIKARNQTGVLHSCTYTQIHQQICLLMWQLHCCDSL